MISSLNRSLRKKKYFNADGQFLLRQYTSSDLCKIYGVSFPAFQKQYNKLKKRIGKKTGYFFTVEQVRVFIEEWGVPHNRED